MHIGKLQACWDGDKGMCGVFRIRRGMSMTDYKRKELVWDALEAGGHLNVCITRQ